jgi:hypothetical protein
MPLSINATLAAALAAGTGSPVIKVEYFYDTTHSTITTDVFRYIIDNTEAEITIGPTDVGTPLQKFRIIRGLTIEGITYLVTSAWFETRKIVRSAQPQTFGSITRSHYQPISRNGGEASSSIPPGNRSSSIRSSRSKAYYCRSTRP